LYTNNNGVLDSGEINTSLTKFVCNGSAATASQGVRIGFQSSTTWTCPAGITQIKAELWGGAGGGGSGSGVSAGYGFYVGFTNQMNANTTSSTGGKGGNGGYTVTNLTVIPGQTYALTVGAGGTGGQSAYVTSGVYYNATNGTNGGQTSFSNLANAPGGTYGSSGTSTSATVPYASTAVNGINGTNGTVTGTNSITIPNSTSPYSYIPVGYVNTLVSPGVAQGGIGAPAIYSSYPSTFSPSSPGANGEPGYIIISY
jgi:hypothetical protein